MAHAPISSDYLEEVLKRVNAATKAPWISYVEGRDHRGGDSVIIRGENGQEEELYLTGATIADQDFIAHARQDIILLLGEIERLKSIPGDGAGQPKDK